MAKVSVRLTRDARARSGNPEAVRQGAVAALRGAGPGEVWFLPFEVDGQRFALSSRIVVEVDWFPHRVPQRLLRRPAAVVRTRRGHPARGG